MKRTFAFILLASLLVIACKSKGKSKEVEIDRLLRLNKNYDSAVIRKDKVALARLYADDYVYTNPEGRVLNKEQQINTLTTSEMNWQSGSSNDVKIALYGPMAVMTGSYTAQGNYRGNSLTVNERYTVVWQKKDTSWQIVAEQGSSIK
jgi:ketosteroid isomerase-like protein